LITRGQCVSIHSAESLSDRVDVTAIRTCFHKFYFGETAFAAHHSSSDVLRRAMLRFEKRVKLL
jgi:hypothetical protein